MTRLTYFEATDKAGKSDVWVTDGTADGTVDLGGLGDIGVSGAGDGGLEPGEFEAFGQKMLFTGADSYSNSTDNGLWLTDGTAGGTSEIGGVSPGFGKSSEITNADPEGLEPDDIVSFGSKALFLGLDTSGDAYLWVTDGTVGNTTEIGGLGNVGILHKGTNLDPQLFAVLGDEVLFDGYDSEGFQGLWITDGTTAGTQEIGGLQNAGIGDSNATSFYANNFITLGDKELFSADNAEGDSALWITDGNVIGTSTTEIGGMNNEGVVGADNTSLGAGLAGAVQFGNRIFFGGTDNDSSAGLWATDGTATGTTEIGGLSDAGLTAFSQHPAAVGLHPTNLSVLGQQLLFNGQDSLGFQELWATDGTALGTTEIGGLADQLLAGVAADGLDPQNIVSLGNVAVFVGQDNTSNGALGRSTLWVTDGTTAGTFELGGPDNQGLTDVYDKGLTIGTITGSDSLAYFMGYDAAGESVLWVTDGTVSGTHPLTPSNGDAPSTGLVATDITAGPAPTTDTPQSLLPQDLTSVAYNSSLEANYNEATGAVKIFNSVNSAVLATIALGAVPLAGAIIKLASDGAGGTQVSLIKFPSLKLTAGERLISALSGTPYIAYVTQHVGQLLTGIEYLFQATSGQSYQFYEEDYNGGNTFIGSKYFFTKITGKNYTGYEEDFNSGGLLTRINFTGVTGQPYSSYELDYNEGIYTGAKFTVTDVKPGAAYSSYVLQYSSKNVFEGTQYFYENVKHEPYTGEELDFNASNVLTTAIYTGMTGTPYDRLQVDYTNGVFADAKYFYDNVTGQTFGAEEVDVAASGELEKVIYSGVTNAKYSSVEQDYYSNTPSVMDTIYTFANPTGKPYYEAVVKENSSNAFVTETLYNNDGSHTITGDPTNGYGQIYNSLGNDTVTGGSAFNVFNLSEGFGHETITDFYDHVYASNGFLNFSDAIYLPSADWATVQAAIGDATNLNGNVVIKAANGDTLTLDHMSVTTLQADAGHIVVT